MIDTGDFEEMNDLVTNLFRANYGKDGIYAGQNQFRDYWARDSFYSCLGSLELGRKKDLNIVKKNLELFLAHVRKGEVPLRIGARSIYHSFIYSKIGKQNKKLHASYRDDKINSISTDSNSLLLIVFSLYIKKTGDYSFARKHWKKIQDVIEFVDRQKGFNGLIQETYFSTWMDSMRKKGNTFYSNLLYYVALHGILPICMNGKFIVHYDKKYLSDYKYKIDVTFFNGEVYNDWIGNNDHEYVETFPNLLAIYFNYVTKKRAVGIMDFFESQEKFGGMIKKCYPEYSKRYISIANRAVGLIGYSRDVAYPWMSFMYYIVLNRVRGFKFLKRSEFSELLDIALRDGTVHECYNITKENFPFYKTMFYKSENPFSWGCSFFVILFKEYYAEYSKNVDKGEDLLE